MQVSDFIIPDWPAPANVHAVFTTRAGGVSKAPFNSLNLGDHVRDDPVAVQANRAILQASIGARPVFLQQVHGVECVAMGVQTPDGTQADACFTAQPHMACTIMVADCLPVLFTNRAGTQVAAAHAGWRGLAAGVLEHTYQCFRSLGHIDSAQAATENIANGIVNGVASGTEKGVNAGSTESGVNSVSSPTNLADVIAWLGPCIGSQAFEVGPEVFEAFVQQRASDAAFFAPQPGGKYLANLSGLARSRLAACGITAIYGNDGSAPWCTVGNPSQFFSHRRDAARLGSTGRMAACIWLG